MTRRLLILWPFILAALAACSVSCADVIIVASAPTGDAPVVLYTDITHGPDVGGEDNNGTYLSIFGVGFGSSRGTSTVEINGTEVATYHHWGTSDYGRTQGVIVQQITVQPGSAVSTGAIEVIVDGVSSNTDHTFTVITGDIYFVDNTIADGGDGNGDGTVNDITDPFRYVHKTWDRGDFGAGDTIVVRGGTNWTDIDANDRFAELQNVSGTSASPVAIVAYPGETPMIVGAGFMLGSNDGYITISGLRIDLDDNSAVGLNLNPGVENCRFVNNRIENMDGRAGGAGACNCNDSGQKFLGCWLENVGSKDPDDGTAKLYHGFYFSQVSDSCEVGWCTVFKVYGGRGVQVYEGSVGEYRFDMNIHHSWFEATFRSAIAFGNNATTGQTIHNNVVVQRSDDVHSGAGSGIAIKDTGVEAEIYNNTIIVHNDDALPNPDMGACDYHNNLIYVTGTGGYFSNSNVNITAANNLYYGGGSAPSEDTNPITSDPLLTNLAGKDYTLTSSSPAKDAGLNAHVHGESYDSAGTDRTQNTTVDVGAFEYDPG